MGRYCRLPSCRNSKTLGSTISLHKFPKDEKIMKLWKQAAKIKGEIKKDMLICSEHFEKTDFFPAREGQRRKLFPTSIPTKYLTERKIQLPPLNKMKKLNSNQERCMRLSRRLNEQKLITTCKEAIKKLDIPEQNCLFNNEKHDMSAILDLPEKTSPEPTESNTDFLDSAQRIENAEEYADQFVTDKIKIEVNCSSCSAQDEDESELPFPSAELYAAIAVTELKSAGCIHERELYTNTIIALSNSYSNRESTTLLQLVNDDEELIAFCGVPVSLLNSLAKAVKKYERFIDVNSSTVKERVALTLCKLRLNCSFICLCVLFNLQKLDCSRYFYKTLKSLSAVLKDALNWPTKEEILNNMPESFSSFRQTRIILHSMETQVEKPKCILCRIRFYSHFKGYETLKVFMGLAPSGLITYVSDAFGGRASDEIMFNESNLLDKLVSNQDAIMVDKGFSIEPECAEKSITLIRPPFLYQRRKFTKEDLGLTVRIISARIHVERAIQEFQTFQIMSGPVPWKMVPLFDNIVTIVAGIVNLSAPILSDVLLNLSNAKECRRLSSSSDSSHIKIFKFV